MKRSSRKKIIFSSYDDLHNPYYAGGGARAIHEVAKELSHKYDVTVLTGNYPGAKNQIVDGIRYKRIGLSFSGPKTGQLFFHLLLPMAVKRAVFDVWIESFTPPFSTTSLQRYTVKPVIGLAHMLSSEDMERKYKLPFYLVERRGLRTYKYFITITEKTKQTIRLYNKKAQINVIPNGVTSSDTAITKSSDGKYILYLGRIEMDQKGLDLLLDAYAEIADKTDVRLVIAGSGTKKEESLLKKYIAAKGLQQKVDLRGRVEGADKKQLLHNASLVAIPSRYETFGMVVLEAMANRKALISFAIDGLNWVPEQCMIKVTQFDTSAMGKELLSLLTDKNKLKKMEEAAGNVVTDYSWHNTAIAYEKMIESVT
jgi:glycosyltransferase involved in cell wall biosynthesis